jgi:hypothetical protein
LPRHGVFLVRGFAVPLNLYGLVRIPLLALATIPMRVSTKRTVQFVAAMLCLKKDLPQGQGRMFISFMTLEEYGDERFY